MKTLPTAPTVHTFQSVHDLIQSQYESDLPDRVLQALRPFEGKAVTSRLTAKMPALPAGVTWRLIRHYGWTSLQTSSYGTTAGYADGSSIDLTLVYSEASVPLNTAWVEEHNPAYYRGRRERNHARMEAMNTKPTLDACAAAMNRVQAAIAAARAAVYDLDLLTDYGTTLAPDKYTIAEVCGASSVDLQKKKG